MVMIITLEALSNQYETFKGRTLSVAVIVTPDLLVHGANQLCAGYFYTGETTSLLHYSFRISDKSQSIRKGEDSRHSNAQNIFR